MGIHGLLPLLASITKDKSLADYAGQRAAIDGYAWLHKASACCAQELCLGAPGAIEKLVRSCIKRVEQFRNFRVTPVLVFDGAPLPSKAATELARAQTHFQKAVDITPYHASRLCEALRSMGVEFVVSPYEADAQLFYLLKERMVDVIVTEDSDLLAYGAARVFFKLDASGTGKEIAMCDLAANVDLNFSNWTIDMFTTFCIMCGCDYVDNIRGVGVKRAHALIHENKTIANVLRRLRLDGVHEIPHNYEANVLIAFQTFRHMRVFDPRAQRLVHATELGPPQGDIFAAASGGNIDFLGADLDASVCQGIAEARLHPCSHEPFASLPLSSSSSSSVMAADASSSYSSSSSSSSSSILMKKSLATSTAAHSAASPRMLKTWLGPVSTSSTSMPASREQRERENHSPVHQGAIVAATKLRAAAVYSAFFPLPQRLQQPEPQLYLQQHLQPVQQQSQPPPAASPLIRVLASSVSPLPPSPPPPLTPPPPPPPLPSHRFVQQPPNVDVGSKRPATPVDSQAASDRATQRVKLPAPLDWDSFRYKRK